MKDIPSHDNAPRKAGAPAERPPRSRKRLWIVALLLLVGMAVLAWFRVGMLDLPPVPRGLTLETAGLANLQQMKQLNALIWSEPQSGSGSQNAAVLSKLRDWSRTESRPAAAEMPALAWTTCAGASGSIRTTWCWPMPTAW